MTVYMAYIYRIIRIYIVLENPTHLIHFHCIGHVNITSSVCPSNFWLASVAHTVHRPCLHPIGDDLHVLAMELRSYHIKHWVSFALGYFSECYCLHGFLLDVWAAQQEAHM